MDPSEKIPVAVSCRLVLTAIEGFTGVMEIEVRTTATLSVVLPVTPLNEAEMMELPEPWPSARPLALMVATLGLDELHVTWLLISWLRPLLSVPQAVNC